jgi:sugar phosphate isomerase/epimerase
MPVQALKWAYQDHWRRMTAGGPVLPWRSVAELDRMIKQVAAVGYTGIQTFDWNLYAMREMFGSPAKFEEFLRERGMEKVVDLFHARNYDHTGSPHLRETHDTLLEECRTIMELCDGLAGVEHLIVMPAALYPDVEPVGDDQIKAAAELWSRVGEMTLSYGVKIGAHHEFFCGIRNADEVEKFYEWSDPRYVFFFLDTAQHAIAGLDPVALYERWHDRVTGWHFKDTWNVDVDDDYRKRPDAELMAPTTPRWFHEMGTPQGLVDFPALVRAMKKHGYSGWVGVEHDKANVDGNYAESTAIAAWYARNVLEPIYREAP